MSPRKAKGPKPGEWRYEVGEIPALLIAFERADRGNVIYSRVWDGKKYSQKKALHPSIRDAQGKIIPAREISAQQLAVRRHTEVLAGVEAEESRGGPLTVAGGFRHLLHRKEGKYPSEGAHRKEVERAARTIRQVIGADRRFDEIRHRDYRALWRHVAHEHRKDRGKWGFRTAEIFCGVLQSAARWLQREGYIEPGDAVPAPGWKQEMRTEWEQILGAPIGNPEKPRYTEAESAKLWSHRAKADPRVRLALEIGAELRLGQVARVKRSDILPHRGHRIGIVRVHGRGKKRGEMIVLTMAQRHALTAALLWGYLAEPEAAFRAGEIEDYFLIGGGRLHGDTDHRGRPVKRLRTAGAVSPITRRALGRQWEELERIAGVDHVAGRLWYGVRRLQADKADQLEGVSDRAKNRMGGWLKTSTREGYLEGVKLEDAEEAARARRRIRPK
jgi:hypothetical protein